MTAPMIDPAERAYAAEVDHDEDIRRLDDVEDAGVDELEEMGEERAGDAREERRDDEGEHLHAPRVDARKLGGDLVLPDGEDAPAEARVNEVADEPDGERPSRRRPTAASSACPCRGSPWAAEGADVLDGRFDDHAEGEGDDGQVVAPRLERREGDHKAHERRGRAARYDGGREKPAAAARREEADRDDGGDVGPYRHEARVAHGELAHIAVDQVEADG